MRQDRIAALIKSLDPDVRIQRGFLTLFPSRKLLLWMDKPVDVSVREYDIVDMLSRRPSVIISRGVIMDALNWSEKASDRNVDSAIKGLRRRFEMVDRTFNQIATRYSLGYYWRDEQEAKYETDRIARRTSSRAQSGTKPERGPLHTPMMASITTKGRKEIRSIVNQSIVNQMLVDAKRASFPGDKTAEDLNREYITALEKLTQARPDQFPKITKRLLQSAYNAKLALHKHMNGTADANHAD